MLYQLSEYNHIKAMILDLPRKKLYIYLSYDTIESVKSGQINSTKYVPLRKTFKSVHVICFANAWPKIEALSDDIWKLYELVDSAKEKQMLSVSLDEVKDRIELGEKVIQSYKMWSDDVFSNK